MTMAMKLDDEWMAMAMEMDDVVRWCSLRCPCVGEQGIYHCNHLLLLMLMTMQEMLLHADQK